MYAGIHITVILGVLSTTLSYNPPYRESTVSINTKKWLHTVSDKFVSLTVDPDVLIKSENYGKAAINMAKSLSPAYLRVGGPGSDHFSFQSKIDDFEYMNNTTITASEWVLLNELLEDAGLNLIICLNAITRLDGVWDSRNTLQLVSFSDRRGYNMDFELGYESQWTVVEGNSFPGAEMGRDVVRLRKILDAYSRYSQSMIIGPDLNRLTRSEDIGFARNYLTEAGSSLSALTLHPRFSSSLKADEDPSIEMLQMIAQLETNIWGKDVLARLSGKAPPRKPIWIAESKRRDGPPQFKDAVNWLRRLGAGAKLGVQVMMAQPHPQSFYTPTPDFWMMTLHKALVGRQVLDSKLVSGNKTMIEAYTHCTQTVHNPDTTILDDTLVKYDRGAVTLFGVNMADEKIRLNFKINIKEEEIHKYVLTEGRDPSTGERITLFNNQKLSLSPDGELPILTPKIRKPDRSLALTLPPKSIFFVVIPDIKARTCMLPLNALLEDPAQATQTKAPIVDEIIDDQSGFDRHPASEESSDSNEIFVSFRSPMFADKSLSKLLSHKDKYGKTTKKANDPLNEPEPIVKYITFSDNNWLSDFPKKIEYDTPKEEDDSLFNLNIPLNNPVNNPVSYPSHVHVPAEAETPASRREKYKIFADAVFGRRNVSSNDYHHSEGNSVNRYRSKRHIDSKLREELARRHEIPAPLEHKHEVNTVTKTIKLSDGMTKLNHFLDETSQNKIHRLYKDRTRDKANPLFEMIDEEDDDDMVTNVHNYERTLFDNVKEDAVKNQAKKNDKFEPAVSATYRISPFDESSESHEDKNGKSVKAKLAQLDAKHKVELGKIREALEEHKRKPRSLSFQDEFFLKLLLDLDLYERMEKNERATSHEATRIKREVDQASRYLNSLMKASDTKPLKSNYVEEKDAILRILQNESKNNIAKVRSKRALSPEQKTKLESYLNEVRQKLNAKNGEKVSKSRPEKVAYTRVGSKPPRQERVSYAKVGVPKEDKIGYAKVAAPAAEKLGYSKLGAPIEDKLGHAGLGTPKEAHPFVSENMIAPPFRSQPGMESTLEEIGQLSRERIMQSVKDKADDLIRSMRSDETSKKVGAKKDSKESRVGAKRKHASKSKEDSSSSSSEEDHIVGAHHARAHRPHLRRSRLRASNPMEDEKKGLEQKVGNDNNQIGSEHEQKLGSPHANKLSLAHAQRLAHAKDTPVGLERPNTSENQMHSAGQPLASPKPSASGQPLATPVGITTGIAAGQPLANPAGIPAGQPLAHPAGFAAGQPLAVPTGIAAAQPLATPAGIAASQPVIVSPFHTAHPAEQNTATLGNINTKRVKREMNPFNHSPRLFHSAKNFADYAEFMNRGQLDDGLEHLNFEAPQTPEIDPHYHMHLPPKMEHVYPGYFVRTNPTVKNEVYRSANIDSLNKISKIPDASRAQFDSDELSEEETLPAPELTEGKYFPKVNEGDMSGKTVVVQVFDESGKKVANKVYSSLQDYMFPNSYNKYLAHSLKKPGSSFDDELQRIDAEPSDDFLSSSVEITTEHTSSEELTAETDRSLQVLVNMMNKIMEGQDDLTDSHYSAELDNYLDVNSEPTDEFSNELYSHENGAQMLAPKDFSSTTPHSAEVSTSKSAETSSPADVATTPAAGETSTTDAPCILSTTTSPPCILTTTSEPETSSPNEGTSTTESSTTVSDMTTVNPEESTTEFSGTTQTPETSETTETIQNTTPMTRDSSTTEVPTTSNPEESTTEFPVTTQTTEVVTNEVTTPKAVSSTTEPISTTVLPEKSTTEFPGTTQATTTSTTTENNVLSEPMTTPSPTEPMTTSRKPNYYLPYVDDSIGHLFKFKRSLRWLTDNEISSKSENVQDSPENDIDTMTHEMTKTNKDYLKEENQKETTTKDPLFTSALHKHYDKMILNAPKMLTTAKTAVPMANDLESSFKSESTTKPYSKPEAASNQIPSVIQKIDKKLEEQEKNGTCGSDKAATEKMTEAYASFLAALANQLSSMINQIQNSFLYREITGML